jgi:hypothetical protein
MLTMNTNLAAEPYAGMENMDRRRLADSADSLRAIASLQASAKKLMASAAAGSASAAKAAADAANSIMAMIMAVIRFLARVFNLKQAPATGATDAAEADSTSPAAAPGSGPVDDMAREANTLIDAAVAAKSPEGDAFLRALEFAGIAEADKALLNFARDPQALAESPAPDVLLATVLAKAEAAFAAIQSKVVQLQTERAESAAGLAADFEPPLLVADLVKMYRKNPDLGMAIEKSEEINRLLKADDSLAAATAHQSMVSQMTLLVASAAKAAGVDLLQHSHSLHRLVGESWGDKVSEFAMNSVESRSAAPVVGEVFDESSDVTDQARQAAAAFLSTMKAPAKAPGAPSTPMERLRQAALAAAKLSPQDDPSSPSNFDDDVNRP